jgi:ABC-type hemin transport system substrate-binding protein
VVRSDDDRPRVVSLVPSVTETLVAWGRPPVACTRFCEQPGIEAVGGTKRPRIARIVALHPDLVVMCDEENRREDHDARVAAGLSVHVASPRSVEDVPAVLSALAEAVAAPRPQPWSPPTPTAAPGGRAFVPIWRRPWMTINADTYGAAVLRSVGVDLVTAGWRERYPTVELDAVGRPDLVLVPSEPYAFSDAHVADLAAAFPTAAVLRVDGQDLFWWGVRTPGAVARLAEQVRSATSSS